MQYLAFIPYCMILAGVGLSYAGVLPAMVGWTLTALGVLAGLGVAGTVIFAGQPDVVWSAVFAALPAVVALPMVINDLRYPRINDVATDVADPPVFVAALQAAPNMDRDMSFPEENGLVMRESYGNVRPLIVDEPPDRAFERIAALAERQHGWRITRRDSASRTVEGEAMTAIFRFVDDFLIRVSGHHGKARIDMRSKSRHGLVDAGKNAQRIQQFFEQLESAANFPPLGHDDRSSRTP